MRVLGRYEKNMKGLPLKYLLQDSDMKIQSYVKRYIDRYRIHLHNYVDLMNN